MSADSKSAKTESIKHEILLHSFIICRLASVKLVILEIRPDDLFVVVRGVGLKCLDEFGVFRRVLIELFDDLL